MQDRRQGVRHKVMESITTNIIEKKWLGIRSVSQSGELLDISHSGARISYKKHLEVGSVIGLHIFLPGVIDNIFEVLVKFNQQSGDFVDIGVEFLDDLNVKELKDLILRISGDVTV